MTRYALLNITALALFAVTPLAFAKRSAAHQIEALRAQGAAGLAIALETGDDALIDQVAGQRHARYSGLFWHTDLDQAIAQATAENKPIVSLTLLGDLREEYTCANSRFFRALLYSNPDIADTLRQDFVLHWQSERDVPKVTVDFGGGRVMTRTITGNSIHYLLDSDGTPMDALPGLYSPEAFAAELAGWERLYEVARGPGADRATVVRTYHERALGAEAQNLVNAILPMRDTVERGPLPIGEVYLAGASSWMRTGTYALVPEPPAQVPMMMAVTKSGVELPLLRGIDQRGTPETNGDGGYGWAPPTDEEWTRMAAAALPTFHPNSVALIQAENPTAPMGGDHEGMMARLRLDVAKDTVRNTYAMRPKLRDWFARGQVADLASLNRRVYDEVFATPASDPWLGLLDRQAYTGLVDGGVAVQ